MGTSVPPLQFTATGFVAPDASAVLTGVQSDINGAFGGKVNPALNTGLGQLASSETAIIDDNNDNLLAIFNGTDPAFATGRQLDGIARIYFLTRNPAQPTTVQAVCTGLVNTPIPTFAQAQDASNNLWICTEDGTIPVGGSITLPFACAQTGPIALPANSLTKIYQAVPGWDTINNPSEGVLGNVVESNTAFRARRAASVAINSVGSLSAIEGAVLAVTNVLDAYVTENDTSTPVTIGGYTLAANSLYVAAIGGDPQAVAQAIWSKKAPGCAYNGNTTETVYDSNSGYEIPYPSYSVSFETPAALPILFAVSIVNSSIVPTDATTQIQNAIISAFGGGDGGPRARIGSTLYASRFYSTVANLGPWAQIISILIGTSSATLNDVAVGIAQAPTVDADDISVMLV